MSVLSEYNALKKKREKQKNSTSVLDEYNALKAHREALGDIAPVSDTAPLFTNKTSSFFGKDNGITVAPTTKTTGKTTNEKSEEKDKRTWFQKGAFEDGYQFGDVARTLIGTDSDILQNMKQGALKFGENVIDAGATVAGFVGEKFGADSFADKTKDFVKKDLTSEVEKLSNNAAAKILKGTTGNMLRTAPGVGSLVDAAKGITAINRLINREEDHSVLGEKSDALVQSATQFAMQMGLANAGVPWYLTAGVTSFGGEAEGAFNEGATYNEAALSGVISAAGEILTEKLFGGSGLGEKGLINLEPLTKGITNKVVKALADYGVDLFSEGAEEVVSQVIGNLGSALYKEENLMDILTSEEAIDGYIESFIGGAVISSGANIGKVTTSVKTGTDYRTGLTTNEQKVVEKEVENRIAEQEKDGKKLTKKEKAVIEEAVVRDMKRGYISTDTIEEVLGGETYKTHKDTIDSEKAMQEEYDMLYQMKNGDKSDAQIDRQAELRQKLDDIKQNFNRNQLQDEVMSMVKGDRLAESYNERFRRGQAFEADISKYDAKQQATIQKAIDSGILNNTNRTHEFVDMVAKITADKGVLFDFTNNERLKESGFAVDGAAVNGYVTKDGVTLNIDSAKSLNRVVGHEITHVLEGTEMYTALQSVVTEYAKTKGEYQGRYDALVKLYETVEGADVDAELTADLVGDYLFSDTDFVNHLSVTNRNVFQKIYDEIKYLCKIATAGSKELRELEKVKRTFEQVYREGGMAQDGTKYSLESVDGIDYVRAEKNIFLKEDGTPASERDIFNSLVGKTIPFPDGDVKIVKRLPKKDMYNELSRRYPKNLDGVSDVKQLNSDVNRNMKELLTNSDMGNANVPDADNKHQEQGITAFDTRKVKFYDGSEAYDIEFSIAVLDNGEKVAYAKKFFGYDADLTKKIQAAEARSEKSPLNQQPVSKEKVPQNGENVKRDYSLSDSDGKQLSKEQQDYFKDSKVRDENGNLMVMYHGTQKGGFTVFQNNRRTNTEGFYFTNDKKYSYTFEGRKSNGQFYPSVKEGIEAGHYNPQRYKVYLDVKNPLVLTADQQDIIEEIGYWEHIYNPIKAAGYDGVMMEDMSQVFVFNPNQIKNVDNEKPTADKDIRYSLSDSNGRKLSDGQSEYFKDSTVRDADGRLKVMYHGTPNGDFTVFKEGTYFTDNKEYADRYQSTSASSISSGKAATNPKTFEVYLNIKKPFDIADAEARNIYINEYIKGGNALGVNPYLPDAEYDKINTIDWTEGEDLRDFLVENGYDYDGIVLDEGADGGYGDEVAYRGKSYMVFSPNQAKNTDNLSPTSDPDIRQSLSQKGEQFAPGKFYGKDMKLEVAPVRETVAENATVEEMFPDDLAPFADDTERFDSLTDADAPPVRNVEYGEHGNPMTMPKSTVNMIAQNVKESLGVPNNRMGEVHSLIEDYAAAEFPSREQLYRELKDKFGTYTEKTSDDAIKDVKNALRKYRLNVSDAIKSEIADYSTLRKQNFGKVLFSRQGTDVDVAYQELSDMYPGFFPEDITNPTDQLLQIIDVANRSHTFEDSYEIPDEAIWYVVDDIEESVRDYQNIQREKDASRTDNDYLDDLVKHGDAYAGDIAPVPETETPRKTAQQTRRKLAAEVGNLEIEMGNIERLREQSNADFDAEIARLQAEHDALRDKNTIRANDILRRIERKRRMKNSVDADFARRIQNLGERIEKISSDTYQTAAQRKVKQQEYTEQMESLVGDTTHWKDKKLGISYKVNTLRRNLRDVVLKADGSRDIEKADAIYEELQGKYNHNEAILNKEAAKIKKPYADMKITKAEDAYIQMLGEFRHNPETTLTEDVVKEFYEKHKGKIDTAKVDRAIEMARKTYDELLVRVNQVLKEQGMKEIPYRKGYFPHFTEEKQGVLAKLFNWKTRNNDIPTDIAGLTENFNPNRSWQSFNKERTSDTTDYSFMKGMDTYVQGALDWVHHIEDIQKNRAFENYLRYVHSEQGVKDKIDAIRQNDEYDAEEMQAQIDLVLAEARNPLNNFVVDLRARTNTLANKKSSMDRGMEEATNRRFYSTMTNISSRVSANMVGGSISSALTNFIPITQSWGQVSPISSLRAMGETIRSTFRDDGTIDKSDFLTNRLRKADDLYKTGWDKVSDAVGIMMEAVDSFTSQTVWRSKYHENINNGMSESEAIQNADQFAENVLAGRSRGNQPTIFDSKNPLVKTLTAFQLEVANQYGYMLKDMPQDMRNDTNAKLVKGYVTMFLGAYAYNALFSSLTGRDAAFDPIGIIEDLLRDIFGDDEEEKEPTDIVMGFAENIMQDIPFVGGLMGGGRVPISSAMPYDGNVMDILEGGGKLLFEGDTSDLTSEWLKPVYYLALPVGGGQIKKTVQGLSMFSDDHPIAGSYTKGGDLRFPVDDTIGSRVKAAMFGQWSSKNARDYFDNDLAPIDAKRIQEYTALGLSYEEYWAYRDDMNAISKRAEEEGASDEDVVKSKYINSVNTELSTIQTEKQKVLGDTMLTVKEKEAKIRKLDEQYNALANERHSSYNEVSFDGDYAHIGSYYYQWYTPEEGDPYWRKLTEAQKTKYLVTKEAGNSNYATNGTVHYRRNEDGEWTKISDKDLARQREVTKELGITPEEYWSKTETSFIPMKSGEYEYAYENPGNYGVAKVVGGYDTFRTYSDEISAIRENNDSDSGIKDKDLVKDYIFGLDMDYGQKIIYYRSLYSSKADRAEYDADIFEYLNGRDDISYDEKVEIFKKLGFEVSADGWVTW